MESTKLGSAKKKEFFLLLFKNLRESERRSDMVNIEMWIEMNIEEKKTCKIVHVKEDCGVCRFAQLVRLLYDNRAESCCCGALQATPDKYKYLRERERERESYNLEREFVYVSKVDLLLMKESLQVGSTDMFFFTVNRI
jgi:hypothetical protein